MGDRHYRGVDRHYTRGITDPIQEEYWTLWFGMEGVHCAYYTVQEEGGHTLYYTLYMWGWFLKGMLE